MCYSTKNSPINPHLNSYGMKTYAEHEYEKTNRNEVSRRQMDILTWENASR